MTKRGWLSVLLIAFAAILFVLGTRFDQGELKAVESTAPLETVAADLATAERANVLSTHPSEPEADFMQILQEGLPTPGCEDVSRPPLQVYDRDYAEAELQRASEILADTDESSLILASAILTADDDEKVRLLQRSLELDPSSTLTMWHLLQGCSGRSCGGQELLDEAARVDGDNAAVWIERARAAIRKEDWASAEVELKKAVAAPRYDIYFLEQAMLVERALAAGSNFSDLERSVAAFGTAAATAIPQYGDLTKACQSETNDTNTWAAICDQLGEVMAAEGGTMIDAGIGIALRRIAAERVGNQKAVAQFQEEEDALRQLQRDFTMSGATFLGGNDYAFHSRYLEYFAAHGELEAFRLAAEDARRLRGDPTYDQCNFVLRREENP